MATKRKFAYYIKGNQIALIQREDALVGSNNSEYGMYKSPTESIADGLEIQYTYVPEYFIKETDDTNTALDTYKSTGGYLILEDTGNDNFSASPESLSDGSYIVLRNAGRWNGLHKVSAAGAGYINTYTKYSGTGAAIAFEETVTLYYGVDAFIDESFEIDLTRYQANAIVYYLKAKMAEDMGDMDQREFFLREFKRQLEKGKSALKRGPYIVQGLKEMRN